MAKLAPPILPLYLYRYRSLGLISEYLTREIEAILKPYIYCSDFKDLNDPMEGFYRPSTALRNKSNYKTIVEKIYARKTGVGIASLSDTKRNELMWTHYAQSYSGLCIEYYASRLLAGLPGNVSLARMGYDDIPPRISSNDARDDNAAARKIFSQKKFNWAYEREWRVLGPVGKAPIDPGDVIRSIFLGSRIADTNKKTILRALRNTEISVYEMHVEGYKQNWTAIQGPAYRNAKKSKAKRRRKA